MTCLGWFPVMPSVASRLAAKTLELLPRNRVSRVIGRLASTSVQDRALKSFIRAYVKAYDVDLADAEIPSGGFRTFDEFFTRRLRPHARPIEGDDNVVVSPADGVVSEVGEITDDATLVVKGHRYTVAELVGDTSDASVFEGGRFVVVYLSPRDYHRVHAPVDGAVSKVRYVGGTLYPVNPFAVAHFPDLFAQNERVVVFQNSERHGDCASVMVGAIGVGRISLSFDASIMSNVGRGPVTHVYQQERQPPHLARGAELGMFHLGSTVVLLLSKRCVGSMALGVGDSVRMGQTMVQPR